MKNLIKMKNNPESAKIGQNSIFLILIKSQNRPKFNFSTSAVNEKPHKTEKQPRIGQISLFKNSNESGKPHKTEKQTRIGQISLFKILPWMNRPNRPESTKFHFVNKHQSPNLLNAFMVCTCCVRDITFLKGLLKCRALVASWQPSSDAYTFLKYTKFKRRKKIREQNMALSP